MLEKLPERIKRRIQITDYCWNWTGSITEDGYGRVYWNHTSTVAHRLVFALLIRKPKKGLVLDHLCENKKCVNPSHLNETTNSENCFRSPKYLPALNSKKTHCLYGHPFLGRNLVIVKSKRGIGRQCRECRNRRNRERTARIPGYWKRYYKKQGDN